MSTREVVAWCDDRVGERLKEIRERKGVSQRQLSFPGCTAAYISQVENGSRRPSLQIIRSLAEKLEISEQYLAWGEEDLPQRVQLRKLLSEASDKEWEAVEAVLIYFRQLNSESEALKTLEQKLRESVFRGVDRLNLLRSFQHNGNISSLLAGLSKLKAELDQS